MVRVREVAGAALPARPATIRRSGPRHGLPRWALVAVAVLAAGTVAVGCGSDEAASSSTTTTEAAPSSDGADVGDASACSAAVMQGSYIYEVHGDQQTAEGFVPVVEVGLMTFDGKGAATRIGTDSQADEEVASTLTYETDAGCFGTMTTDAGATYRATFSPSGDQVTFFAAGKGGQASLDGVADRADPDTAATCDERTLTGIYSYRARGMYGGEPHVEHGFEVYDGKGGVTNVFRVAGVDEEEHLAGTYEVDDDCHAVVTYEDGVTLDQYLASSGDEFFWLQTGGFEKPGLFGGHERRVSTSTDTTIASGR